MHTNSFQEAIRYYKNSKSILKQAKISDGIYYIDRKPVQEACGVAYLSVLKAIDGYLLQYGIEEKKLPKSYDEYVKALKKIAVKDGKLTKMFKKAYIGLHIDGYYKGVQSVDTIKTAFAEAKWIIERLAGKRL